ncbi:MAG: NACHT domain-containing NTPase [Planctomycetota bacterium]
MPKFLDTLAHRWAYTFLRSHIEMMRDPTANPVRNRSILFRFFADLTFEEFFSGGEPGKPWFIDVTIKRTRAGSGDELFRAQELGRVVSESPAPIALLSPPGSGKTTLQLYSFFNCLTPGQHLYEAGFVPCFVSGHQVRESIEHQLQASVGMGGFSIDELRSYLASTNALLFLIDLNRVPVHEQAAFAARITDQLATADTFRARGHRLIVAARNRPELANQLFGAGYDMWSIEPLPRQQIQQFLEDTLAGATLSQSQWAMLHALLAEHGELLCNPFHLSLITILLSRDPERIGEINSTGKLFKLVTEQILAQEFPQWDPLDNAREPRPRTTLETRVHPGDMVVQQIAGAMAEAGVRSLDVDDTFPDLIEAMWVRHHKSPWWPRRSGAPLSGLELEPLLKEHALFRISPEGSHVLWLHDTFQDFYAAKSLAYDPESGASRLRSLDSGGRLDPQWLSLLEWHSTHPRWAEFLPILVDLLEPPQFEQLVRLWCLARFTLDEHGHRVLRPDPEGRAPNRFILKNIVSFLERLGWTDELERLIQPPFLALKVRQLGPVAILPDLEARVRFLLERWFRDGDAVRLTEAIIWLAVDRAMVQEETEGGTILREYLDGAASLGSTRARIDSLDDPAYRFFHLLLLAEGLVRRRPDDPPHEPSRGRLEEAETLLREAFSLPVSSVQLLRQQRDRWLATDLLDCWATINAADLDPDLFERFFRKLDLNRKHIGDTLRLIIARDGLWRAVQLIERLEPDPEERRHYKNALKEVVAHYSHQGLYQRALDVVARAAPHQADELVGTIVEHAIAHAQFDRARELIRRITTPQLREYLHAVLRGNRRGKRVTPPAREEILPRWDAPDGAGGDTVTDRQPGDGGPPEVRSFLVKRRTDLLESFLDTAALAHRPPGEGSHRRLTIFSDPERAAILARWGFCWWQAGEVEESAANFGAALELANELPDDPASVFTLFELVRHLHLADRESEAGPLLRRIGTLVELSEAREARDQKDVRATRNGDTAEYAPRGRQPLRMHVAEQFAYWGLLQPAEELMHDLPRETWYTRGRFYAHYLRYLLAHDGPAAAFEWFHRQPRASRERDRRWQTWERCGEALAAGHAALAADDMTACLQHFDEARAIVNAFRTNRELEPYMSYFRGQMLSGLVLTCLHHEALRPMAGREILAMDSGPMRAFCVGHWLRLAGDERMPDGLLDNALQALGRYDRAFFRGKLRTMKNWAEAMAVLPDAVWRPWVGRWLDEVASDPRLMRYLLADIGWMLSRRDPTRRKRHETLDRVLAHCTEANTVYRRGTE